MADESSSEADRAEAPGGPGIIVETDSNDDSDAQQQPQSASMRI